MKRHLVLTAAVGLSLGLNAASAESLRYATARDIYGFDPHSVTDSFTNIFVHHVYEPLVRYTAELEIEPALATHWEIIEPTRIRYHLREGVTFHQGQELDAEDVAMSLMRAVHPNSPLRGNLPGLVDVEIIDDLTVELIMSGPTPLLNNYLTNIFILDADWLREHNSVDPIDASRGEEGHTTSHANGTGPFVVESRRPDAMTVLAANPDWWDEPQHNLSRIVHTPIASAATRVSALLSGEIDLIEPAPLQDAQRIDSSPGVRMLEAPGLRSIMMGYNLSDTLVDGNVEGNPLQDVRVRQAFEHAIDMDLIRERIMRGKSRVSGALIAPEVPGWTEQMDQRLPYDPDRARELLAEAGYADGFAFNLNCPNDRYVYDERICLAVIAMLGRVGIRIQPQIEPLGVWSRRVNTHDLSMFMLGHAGLPLIDAWYVLSEVIQTKTPTTGGLNSGRYSNPKLDELTQAASRETDEAKRRALMREAFVVEREDIAHVPLHQQPIVWASRKGIELGQAPDNRLRLWLVRMP